jgi:hypothetical protein
MESSRDFFNFYKSSVLEIFRIGHAIVRGLFFLLFRQLKFSQHGGCILPY